MKFEAVSWEGGLIGAETLEKILTDEAMKGQAPGDFGGQEKIRDDILDAWADAKNQWNLFQSRRARQDEKDKYGTTRTRQFWLIPLLGLLGYTLESAKTEQINDRTYPISHREKDRLCPVHTVGFTESLDKKRDGEAGSTFSPHALMQDYINNSECLFGLVSNGLQLRLLRDSSRLIKITYLEFNLERIFEDELYQEFALLYRLLHVSRFPKSREEAADCLLEYYHQDSLENGSRIRDKLSEAVTQAIECWAQGFINHPKNREFTQSLSGSPEKQKLFYDDLLTLVYRILFLLTIEERDLTYPEATNHVASRKLVKGGNR